MPPCTTVFRNEWVRRCAQRICHSAIEKFEGMLCTRHEANLVTNQVLPMGRRRDDVEPKVTPALVPVRHDDILMPRGLMLILVITRT